MKASPIYPFLVPASLKKTTFRSICNKLKKKQILELEAAQI